MALLCVQRVSDVKCPLRDGIDRSMSVGDMNLFSRVIPALSVISWPSLPTFTGFPSFSGFKMCDVSMKSTLFLFKKKKLNKIKLKRMMLKQEQQRLCWMKTCV